MIILATVIILSLDSSNIIERANEAKEATNLANLKEAANVALAEYKLEVSLGNIDSSEISANDYVKDKLEEQGLDTSTMAVSSDGKIVTGLTEVAVKFVGEGVEIGATVTGYDLSSNTTTSYTTSGNENTSPDGIEDTDPTSQTVTRASTLTWKYMGVDENGKALITLDVISNTSTMQLSGTGGYIYGANELDEACSVLYSSDMGTARSMDIDDVNMILGTNPVGVYYNTSGEELGEEVKNTQGLTIGELVAAGESTFPDTYTPDGKDINTYVPNYYSLEKASVKSDEIFKNLVYQNISYWLSSQCLMADFKGMSYFGVRYVSSSNVLMSYLVYSNHYVESPWVNSIRPVVELDSDIDITVNADGSVTLSK